MKLNLVPFSSEVDLLKGNRYGLLLVRGNPISPEGLAALATKHQVLNQTQICNFKIERLAKVGTLSERDAQNYKAQNLGPVYPSYGSHDIQDWDSCEKVVNTIQLLF